MLEKIKQAFTKKDFKDSAKSNDKPSEEWKKLRDTVDRIFDATKEERKKMSTYLDRYNGKIWNEEELESEDSKSFINLYFSTVQQIAPMLTDNRPRWAVVAHKPHLQPLAIKYSDALKYLWDTRDMSMKLLMAVMDAMIMKVGLFKVIFNPDDGFGGNMSVDVVDPREFFIAPGYTDIWDAPFCGMRAKKPLSYIKKRFPKIDKVKAESSTDGDTDVSEVKFGDTPSYALDCKFTTLTEVWMRDEDAMEEYEEEDEDGKKEKKEKKKYPYGKFVYFTANEDLGEEACPYEFNRAPYVAIYDYIKPHDFIGTGELDNTDKFILELNNIWQALVGHFRRYHNPNIAIDGAAGMDPEQIKSTYHQGGQFYTFDSMANPQVNPIRPIQEPELNPIAMQIFNMGPRLLEEISGNTEMAKGVLTTKQEKSASEASILIESSYTRVRQRVRNLEWSVGRLCYLFVRMMQQFYTEPRQYWNREDDTIAYGNISNTRGRAEEIIRSPETAQKVEKGTQLDPEEEQEQEDYKKLIEQFDNEVDPVYFDFDIVIDTNSTLPMDKQSLANLGMRLFERKAIDATALLEVLQWPKGDEIIKRMEKRVEDRQNEKSGGGRPSGSPQPQGQAPQGDMNDLMQALQGGQNG